jgi:hypothetical protein
MVSKQEVSVKQLNLPLTPNVRGNSMRLRRDWPSLLKEFLVVFLAHRGLSRSMARMSQPNNESTSNQEMLSSLNCQVAVDMEAQGAMTKK